MPESANSDQRHLGLELEIVFPAVAVDCVLIQLAATLVATFQK
jgi:hypothetical protein